MHFPADKTIDVTCVGNALIDLLATVEDSILTKLALTKGKMHLVSADEAATYQAALANHELQAVAGGVASNTAKGIAYSGGTVAAFGAIGDDENGQLYRASLQEYGVRTHVAVTPTLTGNAITYITPDAERTFTVCLGAASELRPPHLDESIVAASKILHLEAFQFEGPTQDTVLRAIEIAKAHETKVSLDLCDAHLIKRLPAFLQTVVRDSVDILFMNETEAAAFSGTSAIDSLAVVAPLVDVVVLKLGEHGSIIQQGTLQQTIPIVFTEAVDTTGAGDMYAAGVLYGLTHNEELMEAGARGARLASRVIARIGTSLM